MLTCEHICWQTFSLCTLLDKPLWSSFGSSSQTPMTTQLQSQCLIQVKAIHHMRRIQHNFHCRGSLNMCTPLYQSHDDPPMARTIGPTTSRRSGHYDIAWAYTSCHRPLWAWRHCNNAATGQSTLPGLSRRQRCGCMAVQQHLSFANTNARAEGLMIAAIRVRADLQQPRLQTVEGVACQSTRRAFFRPLDAWQHHRH